MVNLIATNVLMGWVFYLKKGSRISLAIVLSEIQRLVNFLKTEYRRKMGIFIIQFMKESGVMGREKGRDLKGLQTVCRSIMAILRGIDPMAKVST